MKRIDFEIGICFPLILDSLFIFVFGFGFRGAAIATVISQFLSAAYVLLFLEKKAEMKARLLKKKELSGCMENAKNIISLGTAGVIMLLTVLPELKRMENEVPDDLSAFQNPPMTKEERRGIIWLSLKASLTVGLIFGSAAFLFILFCVFVWLK